MTTTAAVPARDASATERTVVRAAQIACVLVNLPLREALREVTALELSCVLTKDPDLVVIVRHQRLILDVLERLAVLLEFAR